MLDWHLGSARWLFIHIPKNAGVSIRKAPELSGRIVSAEAYFYRSRAQVRAVRAAMAAKGEHHGIQHARWRDLDPKVTARLSCVAILRNPGRAPSRAGVSRDLRRSRESSIRPQHRSGSRISSTNAMNTAKSRIIGIARSRAGIRRRTTSPTRWGSSERICCVSRNSTGIPRGISA